MLRCGEETVLPRPFSIHQISNDGFALFYAVLAGGRGTSWLSQRRPEDNIECFGPLGNGFTVQPDSKNLLLVAGGMGIAPLTYLAKDVLRSGHNVRLLYGTADDRRYPQKLLPPGIELVAVTEDGSIGEKGMVTDFITGHINWADQIFACGPMPMYRDLAENHPLLKNVPVQVSLEVTMGCGRGVCYGCAIKTKRGLKLVCQDGPVFDLNDIPWDKVIVGNP
jgi:dihydroorotate dehydrogenase electron transfer subunit